MCKSELNILILVVFCHLVLGAVLVAVGADLDPGEVLWGCPGGDTCK